MEHICSTGLIQVNKDEFCNQLNGIPQSPNHEQIKRWLNSRTCREVRDALSNTKTKLRQQSRTAKLWLSYCGYIAVLKSLLLQSEHQIGTFI